MCNTLGNDRSQRKTATYTQLMTLFTHNIHSPPTQRTHSPTAHFQPKHTAHAHKVSYTQGAFVHSARTARRLQGEIGDFCYHWQYSCLCGPYYTPTTTEGALAGSEG